MKRWIALLMAICLVAVMAPRQVLAEGQSQEDGVQAYPFRFTGAMVPEDVEAVCYYSDDYFLAPASGYDSALATMSLCFELTTWSRVVEDGWTTDTSAAGEAGSDTAWQNAYDLLDRLGFRGFRVSEAWAAAPTTDSIAAVAAHKDISGTTLVALGIRGGNYGQEWASNFTLGAEGEHQGFAEARDQVLAFLGDYLREHEIQGAVKLWLVGYSRAGCVANMVAGSLVDGVVPAQGVTIDPEDLYAYTFEAPMGAMESQTAQGTYDNIHNIINLNDLVPLVAPQIWGFDRYAGDHLLPNAMTNGDLDLLREEMVAHFQTIAPEGEYLVREAGVHHELTIGKDGISVRETMVPVNVLAQEMVDLLAEDLIGDRQTYQEVFQDTIRQLMAILFAEEETTLVQGILDSITGEKLVQAASPMVMPGYGSQEQREQMVRQNVDQLVAQAVEESGEDADPELGDVLSVLLWNLLEAVLDDLARGELDALEIVLDAVDLVGDSGFLQAHYPEVTLAWLMAQDSNYGADQVDMARSSYRIVRVEGAAALEVYQEDTLVAQLPAEGTAWSLHAYEEDGTMTVILPSDTGYQVRVTAADTVSYSVAEYDVDRKEEVRTVRYSRVPAETGAVLTGDVPALDPTLWLDLGTGSYVSYDLTGADGVAFLPDGQKRPSVDLAGFCKGWIDWVWKTFPVRKQLPRDGWMFR